MDATEGREDKGKAESGWTAETEMLLQDWRKRVYAAQSAYYTEAQRLRRWHYLFGIPVVIVSTVVGSAAFASTTGDPGLPNWLVGSLTALAAVLASLQTFLRLAESAAAHGLAADWYAAIRRDIEQLQALPPQIRGKARDQLGSIRKEMNKAGQKAPSCARAFGSESPSASAWRSHLSPGSGRQPEPCGRPGILSPPAPRHIREVDRPSFVGHQRKTAR